MNLGLLFLTMWINSCLNPIIVPSPSLFEIRQDEAYQCSTKYTPFFNIQQNEEINKKCKVKESATQQHIKNAR